MLTKSCRAWRSGRVVHREKSTSRLRTFESFVHSLGPVADMKNIAGTLEFFDLIIDVDALTATSSASFPFAGDRENV